MNMWHLHSARVVALLHGSIFRYCEKNYIAAAKRVFSILDTEPLIKDQKDAKEVDLYNPQITFEKLALSFESKVAIKHIDLKLEPHKIIAFVGRSGSGKTSLSNLLVRFYDPSEGRILINNHDIKDVKLASQCGNAQYYPILYHLTF